MPPGRCAGPARMRPPAAANRPSVHLFPLTYEIQRISLRLQRSRATTVPGITRSTPPSFFFTGEIARCVPSRPIYRFLRGGASQFPAQESSACFRKDLDGEFWFLAAASPVGPWRRWPASSAYFPQARRTPRPGEVSRGMAPMHTACGRKPPMGLPTTRQCQSPSKDERTVFSQKPNEKRPPSKKTMKKTMS